MAMRENLEVDWDGGWGEPPTKTRSKEGWDFEEKEWWTRQIVIIILIVP